MCGVPGELLRKFFLVASSELLSGSSVATAPGEIIVQRIMGGSFSSSLRDYVSQYLGRYTHRVAISNHRLVSLRDGHIKVLLALASCRTAALGGHIDECTRCGHRATIS